MEKRIVVSGNGWSAGLHAGTLADLGIPRGWQKEELEKLSLRQLIRLCRDCESWHKDILRRPADPCRTLLGSSSRFEQIVFLNENVFLFVPKPGQGHTRTVTPDNRGSLRGVGKLPKEEYHRLFRETWMGFASHVLLGPEEVEPWQGGPNDGSIRYWVPGHWRQLSSGQEAHQVSPWGEDRRHQGQTWVNQYCVRWDDDQPCRERCFAATSG